MDQRDDEQVLAAYFEAAGEGAAIPTSGFGWDEELGGYFLENINGPLALVREDGEVVFPVYDPETAEWSLPTHETASEGRRA